MGTLCESITTLLLMAPKTSKELATELLEEEKNIITALRLLLDFNTITINDKNEYTIIKP